MYHERQSKSENLKCTVFIPGGFVSTTLVWVDWRGVLSERRFTVASFQTVHSKALTQNYRFFILWSHTIHWKGEIKNHKDAKKITWTIKLYIMLQKNARYNFALKRTHPFLLCGKKVECMKFSEELVRKCCVCWTIIRNIEV